MALRPIVENVLFAQRSQWNKYTAYIYDFQVSYLTKLAKKNKSFDSHWTELRVLSDVNPSLAEIHPGQFLQCFISLALYLSDSLSTAS